MGAIRLSLVSGPHQVNYCCYAELACQRGEISTPRAQHVLAIADTSTSLQAIYLRTEAYDDKIQARTSANVVVCWSVGRFAMGKVCCRVPVVVVSVDQFMWYTHSAERMLTDDQTTLRLAMPDV